MTTSSQILKEMASLTILSGKISDLHEKNLKLYPYIYFEKVSSVEIEYDLSHHHNIQEDHENNKIVLNKPIVNQLISYYLILDESANDNLENRYLALAKSVKTLLWKDIKVEIYFNRQIKYKG